LEFINNRYRNLKALDIQFSRLNMDSIGAEAFYNFDSTSVQVEMRLNKSLDSLAKVAHALPDRQEALRLQNFIESYKMALEDRVAMQNFYKNAPAPEEHDNSQQKIQQLQYEIKARNKHIAELENKVYSLQKKTGLP
jgi:predicted RNase H-like nuclease (RuvC/YqgF family)